jgi:hypothetical protein
MANPTDPLFLAGFDADAFRQAITSTMEMALPLNEDERITFLWKTKRTYTKADEKGNPYNLDATPTSVNVTDPVQIPAAVEFTSRRPDGSAIGQFENPRVVATILDTYFPRIDGANQALLGGNTYTIDFVEPPIGLGPVTIYRVWLTAVDES